MNTSTFENDISSFTDGCSVLVIIVSYNSGELTVNAIDSLTNELEANPLMRVVVVDNTCGKDSSIIEAAIETNEWHEWVTVIVSPKNGGFSYGNNLAISSAITADDPPKHFWLLNPDTEVYPNACSALTSFLDDNEKVGIVGSCLHNSDGSEWGVAFRFPSIVSELEQSLSFGPFSRLVKSHIVARKMSDKPAQVDWLPGASMMIRLDVFKTVGLFDENFFLYYEETDFCFNAAQSGWACWYVPTSKVMHISGQSTGATGEASLNKPIPDYKFDSRFYYFFKNHGFANATFADLSRISGLVGNMIINFVRLKKSRHYPNIFKDSIKHFAWFKYFRKYVNKRSHEL